MGTPFVDLNLYINEGQIQTSLYDKRNSYNFNVVTFPYKCSTIPSKMFFATTSAEILQNCQAIFSVVQFIKTSNVFVHLISSPVNIAFDLDQTAINFKYVF